MQMLPPEELLKQFELRTNRFEVRDIVRILRVSDASLEFDSRRSRLRSILKTKLEEARLYAKEIVSAEAQRDETGATNGD